MAIYWFSFGGITEVTIIFLKLWYEFAIKSIQRRRGRGDAGVYDNRSRSLLRSQQR